MLSLPTILPRDDHNLWHRPRHHISLFDTGMQGSNPSHYLRHGQNYYPDALARGQGMIGVNVASHPGAVPNFTQTAGLGISGANSGGTAPITAGIGPGMMSTVLGPSPLMLLHADELILAQRKLNIRRFGAGWLRPPGVSKTFQAIMDEAAEKEEQELLARRQAQMEELAAAQEAELLRMQMLEQVNDFGDRNGDSDGNHQYQIENAIDLAPDAQASGAPDTVEEVDVDLDEHVLEADNLIFDDDDDDEDDDDDDGDDDDDDDGDEVDDEDEDERGNHHDEDDDHVQVFKPHPHQHLIHPQATPPEQQPLQTQQLDQISQHDTETIDYDSELDIDIDPETSHDHPDSTTPMSVSASPSSRRFMPHNSR